MSVRNYAPCSTNDERASMNSSSTCVLSTWSDASADRYRGCSRALWQVQRRRRVRSGAWRLGQLDEQAYIAIRCILAVTAGLVYLANETYQGRSDDFAAQTGDVFSRIERPSNDTAIIKVTTPEGPATLERKGDSGPLKRGGYLASQANVNRLLVGLSFLKTIEPKTSKPERYERIGLENLEPSGYPVISRDRGRRWEGVVADVVGDRKPARAIPTRTSSMRVLAPAGVAGRRHTTKSSDVVDWTMMRIRVDVHRVSALWSHRGRRSHGCGAYPGVDEGFSIQNVPAGRVENPLVRNMATGIMKFILDDVVQNRKPRLSKNRM